MAGPVRSNGDNAMEMHVVIYQADEAYVPGATTNVVHDIQNTLRSQDLNQQSVHIIATNLASSPNEPQIQGHGELQNVTNSHKKVCIRSPRQKWKPTVKLHKLASHLSAPEGGIIK